MKKSAVLVLVIAFIIQSLAVAFAANTYSSSITTLGSTKVLMASTSGSSPASAVIYVKSDHYWDGGAYVSEKRIGGGTSKKKNSTSVTRSKTFRKKTGAYRVAGTHKWYVGGVWTTNTSAATKTL